MIYIVNILHINYSFISFISFIYNYGFDISKMHLNLFIQFWFSVIQMRRQLSYNRYWDYYLLKM